MDVADQEVEAAYHDDGEEQRPLDDDARLQRWSLASDSRPWTSLESNTHLGDPERHITIVVVDKVAIVGVRAVRVAPTKERHYSGRHGGAGATPGTPDSSGG